MEAEGIRIVAPIVVGAAPAAAILAVICLGGLLAATIWISFFRRGGY